jgi:hypothetical protein
MRRCRGLFKPSGAFSRHQFSADYIITMFGFDFRQGQALAASSTFSLEPVDKIGRGEEAAARTGADTTSCDRNRQMRLASAGPPNQDDIALLSHEVTTRKIAHEAFVDRRQRSPAAVAHGVQFRVQAALGAADTSGNRPFFKRLAAVRCAFRWVASIISRCGLPHQRGENLIEDPKTAPAHETVVDRLVRAVAARRVSPLVTKTIPLTTRRSSTRSPP